ncbi:hypothetical protein KAFR_0D04810 [Kazachstania africana CBS 2517]|uniref:Uncharacterized protein n=1 Tax=Kazachstania africana (strain ATCC 22294 / BCRC 22015 / CBS 2517 / CECT 1963 / NBRC 1671 / NRRL Y-8276) TaxID=1071382 RepID=H2AUS8_KAZAF|nr:hypothetical protein KAFR_0D04810 [Kazachstania africana CBS 2517]CCF58128.1 hypothetical protein KAFR_0D04810 [Kazachstania africana CBS 2517]
MQVPDVVSKTFMKFPLKTYDPVKCVDEPLQRELDSRSYYFPRGGKHEEKVFTLCVDVQGLDQFKKYVCSEPVSLFIQLALCYKNELKLPTNKGCDGNRMLVLRSRGNDRQMPFLLVDDRIIPRDVLLSQISNKICGLDKYFATYLDKIMASGTPEKLLQGLLLQLEDYVMNTTDINVYLQLKIISYISCMLHSGETSRKIFIQDCCPHLVQLSATVIQQYL